MPTILEEAAAAVDGPRRDAYGPPHKNHCLTSRPFFEMTGHDLGWRNVILFNVAQKLSRLAHTEKRDSLVDVCGYLRNYEMCLEAEAKVLGEPVDGVLPPLPTADIDMDRLNHEALAEEARGVELPTIPAKKPTLHITVDDIGAKFKTRDGRTATIHSFEDTTYSARGAINGLYECWNKAGQFFDGEDGSPDDLVERL